MNPTLTFNPCGLSLAVAGAVWQHKMAVGHVLCFDTCTRDRKLIRGEGDAQLVHHQSITGPTVCWY